MKKHHLKAFILSISLMFSCLITNISSAVSFSWRCGVNGASCVQGSMTVHRDNTRWSLTVLDNKADGHCAYAKVVIDRSLLPDPSFRSGNACPKGNTFSFPGNRSYSRTRGAWIYSCIDISNAPDQCSRILYVPEI
jgi:hypothetical protein